MVNEWPGVTMVVLLDGWLVVRGRPTEIIDRLKCSWMVIIGAPVDSESSTRILSRSSKINQNVGLNNRFMNSNPS